MASLARLVRKSSDRAEQGVVVVEGPTLLAAALEAGTPVTEVYVDHAKADRAAVADVLSRLAPSATAWVLPEGVLDRVGDAATSQGIIALCAPPAAAWPEPATAPFVLVLDDLAEPGNVGTLIRSAAAAGAGGVVIAGGTDPTAPKVVRSSAGAVFTVDIVRSSSSTEAVQRLSAAGYRIVVAAVRGGEAHDTADLSGPVALVIGNEAHGVIDQTAALADLAVTVAMAGPTESLNAAMAGTVLCFEVLRRRSG
ncbi:MAG: TrmH family RNA methyltransferase [Acidimicrobiales bacterium]